MRVRLRALRQQSVAGTEADLARRISGHELCKFVQAVSSPPEQQLGYEQLAGEMRSAPAAPVGATELDAT